MKKQAKDVFKFFLAKAIQQAVREQGLQPLYNRLEQIVPDISDQYSGGVVFDKYITTNVRAEHAFQISMVQEALKFIKRGKKLTIVDIGDSSGNHLRYLKHLFKNINSLSVNIDEKAVEKIKAKGLKAIHARAENVEKYNVKPDLFLSFEMLEHLHDPCLFLKRLSETKCKALVVTVPFVAQSRVGLQNIRAGKREAMNGENTHVFELSPQDWKLLFLHSGWEAVFERVYLQYPRFPHPYSLAKEFFKRKDFEGFYGAVLKPNPLWRGLYTDW